jgi:HPt (histidine-containing phosphotransfer) domain-containing protein
VTAGALKEEKRRALAAGMNDFLAKPLDPKALIATVRQHVEQHRNAPMPVTGARPTQAAPAHWPQIEGIDADDAAARLGSDREMFKRMLGWLVTDYSDITTELAPQALSERLQDAEVRQRLCARVHKLRGSAGTLGAQRLQQAATAAEADLKAPQADASASAQALLEALEQLTEACQPFLTEGVSSAAQAGAPAPLEQADLEELRQLLGAQDFHALERFHAVEKALESQLTARDFAALQAAMQQLDFAGALALLARHGGS